MLAMMFWSLAVCSIAHAVWMPLTMWNHLREFPTAGALYTAAAFPLFAVTAMRGYICVSRYRFVPEQKHAAPELNAVSSQSVDAKIWSRCALCGSLESLPLRSTSPILIQR